MSKTYRIKGSDFTFEAQDDYYGMQDFVYSTEVIDRVVMAVPLIRVHKSVVEEVLTVPDDAVALTYVTPKNLHTVVMRRVPGTDKFINAPFVTPVEFSEIREWKNVNDLKFLRVIE